MSMYEATQFANNGNDKSSRTKKLDRDYSI